MDANKIKILGSGFTEEEYKLYRFDLLEDPELATNFLSHKERNAIFNRQFSSGSQAHTLEDKWNAQNFFEALHFPTPRCIGCYHKTFGTSSDGSPLIDAKDFHRVLGDYLPKKLFFKPRGGRTGNHVYSIKVVLDEKNNKPVVTQNGDEIELQQWLNGLPTDAFDDYDGSYQGWLVQEFISQHHEIHKICANTVNTVRVITFLNKDNNISIPMACIKFGRDGNSGDNWDKGGISVGIDLDTGEMKEGVYKPKYSCERITIHPDSNVEFYNQVIPYWNDIKSLCVKASMQFSGVRTIGWDIAITDSGPIIVEGNNTWDLAMVQVHSPSGFLSLETRKELATFGLSFTSNLPNLPLSIFRIFWKRVKQSRISFLFN